MIPNRKREHVGPNLSSGLRGSDLSAALAIVRKAEGLANELGISRARVFINPVNKISVGYLHVHVVGERDPDRPYPHIADQ